MPATWFSAEIMPTLKLHLLQHPQGVMGGGSPGSPSLVLSYPLPPPFRKDLCVSLFYSLISYSAHAKERDDQCGKDLNWVISSE